MNCCVIDCGDPAQYELHSDAPYDIIYSCDKHVEELYGSVPVDENMKKAYCSQCHQPVKQGITDDEEEEL